MAERVAVSQHALQFAAAPCSWSCDNGEDGTSTEVRLLRACCAWHPPQA